VWRNAGADNPMEEPASAVGRVSRKPVGLQAQRLFGALDHGLGRGNFVVSAGRNFNRAMSSFSTTEAVAIANAYDFSDIRSLTEVAGGGSQSSARMMR
jgi:hypothetical protein